MNIDVAQIKAPQYEEHNYTVKSLCSTSPKEHFNKICRTCLTEGDIKSMFDVIFEGETVPNLLKCYTSLEVQKDDSMPQNMCLNCLTNLFQTCLFIRKCKDSDAQLRCWMNLEESENEQIQSASEIVSVKFDEEVNDLPLEANDLKSDRSEEDEDYSIKKSKPKVPHKRKLRRIRGKSKYKCSSYLCPTCGERFEDLVSFRNHRKQMHPGVRKHSCNVCNKSFASGKLRQHMRTHTKEKPHKCDVCFQAFSMSGNLKRHMMTHTGERPHVCEVCGKGFIQSTTLTSHRKTHTKQETISGDANSPHFVCDYCGRGFKRLGCYKAHLKKHFSVNNDDAKPLQESVPREHVCMICKRAYKTKHLLKSHQLRHGEKSFLCSECGKGFITKAALQSHFKVHTGEKPYSCNICPKSFAHIGSFAAHVLTHTGQKPYTCKICAKAFTQNSHLKYHLRTHSGEKPYMCSYCGKRFALKGNLTVHIRTHTGETPYLCCICGKGFYDSSSMKKHKRGHKGLIDPQVIPAFIENNVNNLNNVDLINSISCNNLSATIN